MSRRSLFSVVLLALAACQAKTPSPTPQTEGGVEAAKHAPASQRMGAAGVELTLPETWTIVEDGDPNFALARGPGNDPLSCTIEVRRQPTSERAMPGLNHSTSVHGRDDYRRGRVRGRVQRLMGSPDDAATLVHCVSPRGREWQAIEEVFDSIIPTTGTPITEAPIGDTPIAELCTGTPVRQTYVCARKRDGAVYCGISEGDTLARVELPEPAQQLACEGIRACARLASGALSCWGAEIAPEILSQGQADFASSRDLAGGCIVTAKGTVSCRERLPDGRTTERFLELLPLDDPTLALTEVDHVLAGSEAAHGCVLASGQLRCWDRGDTLGLALPDHTGVHPLPTPANAGDLAELGGRVCVAAAERWTCIEGDRRFEFDGCERRACGCSLTGAMALSCEHEPLSHGDARSYGRIAEVVIEAGACAVLRDGSVVCRGPVTGELEDKPRIRELVIGGRPGMLHEVQLLEAPSTG